MVVSVSDKPIFNQARWLWQTKSSIGKADLPRNEFVQPRLSEHHVDRLPDRLDAHIFYEVQARWLAQYSG